ASGLHGEDHREGRAVAHGAHRRGPGHANPAGMERTAGSDPGRPAPGDVRAGTSRRRADRAALANGRRAYGDRVDRRAPHAARHPRPLVGSRPHAKIEGVPLGNWTRYPRGTCRASPAGTVSMRFPAESFSDHGAVEETRIAVTLTT